MASPKILLKPNTPKINFGNDLTHGLDHAIGFYENAGTNYHDALKTALATGVSTPIWKIGKFGIELSITSGAGSYINSGFTYNISSTTNLTFSILAKVLSTAASTQIVLFGSLVNSGTDPELVGYILGSSSRLGFYYNNNNVACDIQINGIDYRDNNYHLFTFVLNNVAQSNSVYVDGVFLTSLSNTVGAANLTGNNFYIGNENSSNTSRGQILDGSFSLFLVHSRALTATEIRSLYLNVWQIYTSQNYIYKHIFSPIYTIPQFSMPLIGNDLQLV